MRKCFFKTIFSLQWMRDRRPIDASSRKYIVSQSGRKFRLNDAELTDEGMYSCRVTNKAGATIVDFNIVVLEPPTIQMLESDRCA